MPESTSPGKSWSDATPPTFIGATAFNLPTGVDPTVFTVGDFNGDGVTDFVETFSAGTSFQGQVFFHQIIPTTTVNAPTRWPARTLPVATRDPGVPVGWRQREAGGGAAEDHVVATSGETADLMRAPSSAAGSGMSPFPGCGRSELSSVAAQDH